MNSAYQTDKRLKTAILDLLVFGANHHITLSDQEILHYIPVKASSVGVSAHLRSLISLGKVKKLKDGSYGIKKVQYPKIHRLHTTNTTKHLPKATKRILRWVKLIPFIKAVIVCHEDSLPTKSKGTTKPRLIYVTMPNRIYLTKDIVQKLFHNTKHKSTTTEDKKQETLKSSGDIYYSTAGIRFADKMSLWPNNQVMWFAMAQPLYGQKVWQNLMQNDKFIYTNLPNYPWLNQENQINVTHSRHLDQLDNRRYRYYLRQMSTIMDHKNNSQLTRIRPDVFIAQQVENKTK